MATVTLPPAPPEAYLRWMAFWRQVERKMVEHPALEALASRESVPFVRDPVANFISTQLVRQVVNQAAEAQRTGSSVVPLEITGPSELLSEAMDYVGRRASWLEQPGVLEAMDIEPLSSDLLALRANVVRTVREQLARRARRAR